MGYDERIRLLYVACTRARDHLVVSLHRAARAVPPRPNKRTNAELLLDGMGDRARRLPSPMRSTAAVPRVVPAAGASPPRRCLRLAEWSAARDEALARQPLDRRTIAATALTDEGGPDAGGELGAGLQKRPRDLDLPPWLKGRYGTAVGRAVHGMLQTIDLASGDGLDAAVAAQCEAEAIPDRADVVRRLAAGRAGVTVGARGRHAARTGARSTPARRSTAGCSRGTSTCCTAARTGSSWSTTRPPPPSTATSSTAASGGTGSRAPVTRSTVAATTGEPVDRVTFVFLTPSGPIERHLADLPAAVEEVRALVRAGREVTVDGPE